MLVLWHNVNNNWTFVFTLQQEKPKLIDPLDYEAVISELVDELKEDPLRELLLFPDHDFTVSVLASLCPVITMTL